MKRITFLKKGISLVCAILMLTAVLPTALAAEYTSDDCYVEGYDTSVEIVEEGAVLLKNATGLRSPCLAPCRITMSAATMTTRS